MAVNEKKEEFVYRISTAGEWEELQKTGATLGGEIDRSTGCIHLSSLHQVKATLKNFFEGRDDLFLLQIDASELGEGLIYEKNDDSNFFPHFYSPSRSFMPLPLIAITKADKLALEFWTIQFGAAFTQILPVRTGYLYGHLRRCITGLMKWHLRLFAFCIHTMWLLIIVVITILLLLFRPSASGYKHSAFRRSCHWMLLSCCPHPDDLHVQDDILEYFPQQYPDSYRTETTIRQVNDAVGSGTADEASDGVLFL